MIEGQREDDLNLETDFHNNLTLNTYPINIQMRMDFL